MRERYLMIPDLILYEKIVSHPRYQAHVMVTESSVNAAVGT